jgi:predicted phage tail protein
MKNIHLYGRLRRTYGGPFRFDIETTSEAIRALSANLPGFRRDIAQGQYRIVRGDLRRRDFIGLEALDMRLGNAMDLHIIPLVAGAKRGGIGKAVIGVALIATAFMLAPPSVPIDPFSATQKFADLGGFYGVAVPNVPILGNVTFGQVALFGLSLSLRGVADMLSPLPKVADANVFERPDQRASFLFAGPVNVSEQGHPVPLVYGQARVGSVVASAGLENVDIET